MLDECRPLPLEELAQSRRQQRDGPLGDELVRLEAPRPDRHGLQQQDGRERAQQDGRETATQHDADIVGRQPPAAADCRLPTAALMFP